MKSKVVEIALPPGTHNDLEAISLAAFKKVKKTPPPNAVITVLKRSIDARGKKPIYRLKVRIGEAETPAVERTTQDSGYRQVENSRSIIVVGAGPAGYFAALELIMEGYKPVVLDRGKDVRDRRRDLKNIQQLGLVDPHSNYCYGEGGAGTYSDGKLYTRARKRGDYQRVIEILIEHGAPEDIRIDAHPHIGSNKLPRIVQAIRETIVRCGGEVHFGHWVTDFILEGGKINGVVVNGEKSMRGEAVILATGHSARDIYHLLHKHKLKIEAKPFALGMRVEHPQSLIDSIQYNMKVRGEHLPASSYGLACQVDDKGVFSFCMCPGGLVVPASTAPGEIVVNGMSLSKRDSPYANAGTVVAVDPREFVNFESDPFVCMDFQAEVEQTVFAAGDGTQAAPAQRLTDFCNGVLSADLPNSSYIPGLLSRRVDEILPRHIVLALQKGVQQFNRKLNGYYTREAVVIATESRTSAPVKIPRDKDSLMHPQVVGLFPCGEGAGYAGGIASAAMDGQKVARATVLLLAE
nr:FAD-binding protein [Saprospiraceae bacterium]